jgi:hypothetical protein
MLKYASRIFLKIFLSVLATVIGSYLAHQYIADRPVAGGSVSLADVTVGPRNVNADGAPRETVKAEAAVSVSSSDVVNAPRPAVAVGSRIAGQKSDGKAARPFDQRAEPTSVPVRLHRSAPREKRVSKANTIATPAAASPTIGAPEPGRMSGEDDTVSRPPDPGMPRPRLASRVLKPIIRTALLILEPSSLLGHVHEPPRRTPPDEGNSSSRLPRFQPQVTGRSSSEPRSVSKDGLSSKRPETKAPEQWP